MCACVLERERERRQHNLSLFSLFSLSLSSLSQGFCELEVSLHDSVSYTVMLPETFTAANELATKLLRMQSPLADASALELVTERECGPLTAEAWTDVRAFILFLSLRNPHQDRRRLRVHGRPRVERRKRKEASAPSTPTSPSPSPSPSQKRRIAEKVAINVDGEELFVIPSLFQSLVWRPSLEENSHAVCGRCCVDVTLNGSRVDNLRKHSIGRECSAVVGIRTEETLRRAVALARELESLERRRIELEGSNNDIARKISCGEIGKREMAAQEIDRVD